MLPAVCGVIFPSMKLLTNKGIDEIEGALGRETPRFYRKLLVEVGFGESGDIELYHPKEIDELYEFKALTHIDWKLSLIYSERGRESIPPERLLRALLLQILFSIRSERQLVEQIQYNMLYRWFVERSFQCRWHFDAGLGFPKEFSAEAP